MSKKNIILIAFAVLALTALGVVGFSVFLTLQDKDAELEFLNSEIDALSWQVETLGDVVEVYTVNVSKKSGSIFDQSDIDVMAVPSSQLTDQYITDLQILRNCIYKIDVEPGMPLMKGLFFREVLSQTDRYHDIVADLFPIGASVGDFYDLRIVTPNGLDYIVLSKKRVIDFYGSAVRFVLSEEELHQYQSALVDVFINPGTYLYMTTYVEPAMQKRASIFYPVSDLVLAIMQIDPNIVQLAESDMIMRRRAAYEQGLEIDEELNDAIIAGRSEQISRIIKAGEDKLKTEAKEAPSDGSDSGGSVDASGNLMGGGWDGRTEQQMQFDSSFNVAPDGIQNSIDGNGW